MQGGRRRSSSMSFRLEPRASLGWVHLTVSSLQRSLSFYEGIMGFRVLGSSGEGLLLGAGDDASPLLILTEQEGAGRKPPWARGLYHFAVLLPSRQLLAQLALRLLRHWELQGASDHLVSEAVYLEDPDGHGIELCRDRPREQWPTEEGMLRMATLPLDLDTPLAELRGGPAKEALSEAWRLPGARLGHIHLHVSDLQRSERFYEHVLGLEVKLRWHGASFLSAGGYHHHVGLNVWAGRGAPPPPPNSVQLRAFSLRLSRQGLEALEAHLRELGLAYERTKGLGTGAEALALSDPDGNRIIAEAAEARVY